MSISAQFGEIRDKDREQDGRLDDHAKFIWQARAGIGLIIVEIPIALAILQYLHR